MNKISAKFLATIFVVASLLIFILLIFGKNETPKIKEGIKPSNRLHDNINHDQPFQKKAEEKIMPRVKKGKKEPLSLDEYFSELKQLPAKDLWEKWKIAIINHGPEINLIQAALEKRLRSDPDPEVLNSIRENIESDNIPSDEKAILVDLLTRTASQESLGLLIDLAQSDIVQSDVKDNIFAGISHIGKYQWGGRYHEELSPVLEKEWGNCSEDEKSLKAAIAGGLASVGSCSGVELLLNTIVQEKDNQETIEIATSALNLIRNPSGISPLADNLLFHEENAVDPVAFEASGDALSFMGSPDATKVLLKWAKYADKEDSISVERWFSRVRDPGSFALIEGSMDSDTFQSEKIRSIIENRINQHKKASSPVPIQVVPK